MSQQQHQAPAQTTLAQTTLAETAAEHLMSLPITQIENTQQYVVHLNNVEYSFTRQEDAENFAQKAYQFQQNYRRNNKTVLPIA